MVMTVIIKLAWRKSGCLASFENRRGLPYNQASKEDYKHDFRRLCQHLFSNLGRRSIIMEKSEKIKKGEELMRKMGGDSYLKGREERTRLFPDMNEFVMGTIYGDIWQRPALDLRSRSLCMLAIALGMPEAPQNLRLHIQGALANGLTKEEILEVAMHVGLYVGYPKVVTSMNTVVEVFKEVGLFS